MKGISEKEQSEVRENLESEEVKNSTMKSFAAGNTGTTQTNKELILLEHTELMLGPTTQLSPRQASASASVKSDKQYLWTILDLETTRSFHRDKS